MLLEVHVLESAVINLENGNQFKIETENYSEKNIYIKEVYLNGELLNRTFIKHEEIINGGTLRFIMSSTPNKKWGSDESLSLFAYKIKYL
jgi:putative alpha-1,2-mannosidase